MVSMTNIPIIENNHRFLFKNNVQYTWARFMQVSKITKKSMTMFFINPNLVSK